MSVLYVYAMKNDSGFAPSISENLLTLTCCKRKLRSSAQEQIMRGNDVWVLGLCGKGLAGRTKERVYSPVYLAQIHEALPMADYYRDDKYKTQFDHAAYKVVNGELISTENNPHKYNGQLIESDIKGGFALLSRRFVYWGNLCGQSGTELKEDYPVIYKGYGGKKGIIDHYRDHIIDAEFPDISERFAKYSWFPGENEAKILSAVTINGNKLNSGTVKSSCAMVSMEEEVDDESEISISLCSCGGK